MGSEVIIAGPEAVPELGANVRADLPPSKKWVRVQTSLSLEADGAITRTMTIEGKAYALTPFHPSASVGPLAADNVAVKCGVIAANSTAAATAETAVFVKDLELVACPVRP